MEPGSADAKFCFGLIPSDICVWGSVRLFCVRAVSPPDDPDDHFLKQQHMEDLT